MILPFAEGMGVFPGAGLRVTAAIYEELFRSGKIETISSQRVSQTLGGTRYDPLDVGFARQVGQRLGAGLALIGLVDRFQVNLSQNTLVFRFYTKDATVSVSAFHLIDVSTGQRVLSDAASHTHRMTAIQAAALPSDEEMVRVATQRVAVEIVQRVSAFWGRRTGDLTVQVTEAVIAGNVTRDADFRLRPTGAGGTFPTSTLQLVAYVAGTGARAGQRFDFVWFGPDGREFARGQFVIPPEQQADQPFYAYHVIRPTPGGTFPSGRWRVEVVLDGYAIRTLTFAAAE